MIGTAVLNLIYVFVLGIVSLLSSLGTVSPDNRLTSAITAIDANLSPLAFIFPLGTIVAIFLFVLAFENAYLLYKAIRWGYSKIPGIN